MGDRVTEPRCGLTERPTTPAAARAARPWRVARSLLQLRAEIDAVAPDRSRASDGTIGDAAHAARTSDHNPYIVDAAGIGVVRALDVTHDPNGGCDARELAEHVRQLGAAGDPRVRYVISDHRIASPIGGWAWRRYTGANPHTLHTHVSVVEGPAYDLEIPWGWEEAHMAFKLSEEDVQRIAHATRVAILNDFAHRDRVWWGRILTGVERILARDPRNRARVAAELATEGARAAAELTPER